MISPISNEPHNFKYGVKNWCFWWQNFNDQKSRSAHIKYHITCFFVNARFNW